MIEVGDLLVYFNKHNGMLDYWIILDFKEKKPSNNGRRDHGFLLFRAAKSQIDTHYIDPETIKHWINSHNGSWSVELVKSK